MKKKIAMKAVYYGFLYEWTLIRKGSVLWLLGKKKKIVIGPQSFYSEATDRKVFVFGLFSIQG